MRDARLIASHRGGLLEPEDHRRLAAWAAACAGRVLPLFTRAVDDPRPARAIDMARAWAAGDIRAGVAMRAAREAHAAARCCAEAVAVAAARAAGHAAATAHAADHAMGSLLYAMKALRLTGASAEPELEANLARLPPRLAEPIAAGLAVRVPKPGGRAARRAAVPGSRPDHGGVSG